VQQNIFHIGHMHRLLSLCMHQCLVVEELLLVTAEKVLLSYVGVSDDAEQVDFIFFGEERTTDMTDWVDDC
jgi:hypothetical protein